MNNTINRSNSIQCPTPKRIGVSRESGSPDTHGGSVEATPSWFNGRKLLGSLGVLALAATMLTGCNDTPDEPDDAPVAAATHPAPQAPPAPPSQCQVYHNLSVQPKATDETEAKSQAADLSLAQSSCQIEISQKQAEAAQKQAEASQKMAAAQQQAANAQAQQARIAQQQQDAANAAAGAKIAVGVGGALMDGINGILR